MYRTGIGKCKSGVILNMCSIVVNIDVPLMMFLLGTKMCPKILPTMLFCLSIAFVSALSPGANGFLGFNCFLAKLMKTPFKKKKSLNRKGKCVLSDWLKPFTITLQKHRNSLGVLVSYNNKKVQTYMYMKFFFGLKFSEAV